MAGVDEAEPLELGRAAGDELGEGGAFQAFEREGVRRAFLLDVVVEGIQFVQVAGVDGNAAVVLGGLATAHAQDGADELLLLQGVVLVPGQIGGEHGAHAGHVAQHGVKLGLDEVLGIIVSGLPDALVAAAMLGVVADGSEQNLGVVRGDHAPPAEEQVAGAIHLDTPDRNAVHGFHRHYPATVVDARLGGRADACSLALQVEGVAVRRGTEADSVLQQVMCVLGRPTPKGGLDTQRDQQLMHAKRKVEVGVVEFAAAGAADGAVRVHQSAQQLQPLAWAGAQVFRRDELPLVQAHGPENSGPRRHTPPLGHIEEESGIGWVTGIDIAHIDGDAFGPDPVRCFYIEPVLGDAGRNAVTIAQPEAQGIGRDRQHRLFGLQWPGAGDGKGGAPTGRAKHGMDLAGIDNAAVGG